MPEATKLVAIGLTLRPKMTYHSTTANLLVRCRTNSNVEYRLSGAARSVVRWDCGGCALVDDAGLGRGIVHIGLTQLGSFQQPARNEATGIRSEPTRSSDVHTNSAIVAAANWTSAMGVMFDNALSN
jgi:hypothetical protein